MNKIQNIYYLTDSKEVEFIISLANNDKDNISSKEDFEKNVLKKLFRHKSLNNASCDYFYLKNKYLYLFTEGAISFIEANSTMGEGKNKLSNLEADLLKETIASINDKEINIVSFGSGTSETELKAISNIKDKTINYYALDVSLYLLEIGIINYVEKCKNNDTIVYKSIIADIWDAAKPDNIDALNTLINRNVKTIFTFFGGTIGNYPEKEIISQFLKIMNANDVFIVGYDIWKSGKASISNKEKVKEILFNKYNTIGNLQFLIQPLRYIPIYSGYINHFSKYFSFSKEDSVLIDSSNENEIENITNVENSIAYAPYLKIPDSESNVKKIRLAQSTKYFTTMENSQNNPFTKFLESIKSDNKKLKILLTRGEMENSGMLGCSVSKFVIESIPSKTETKSKKSHGITGK